jgi:hypothetical protein
VLPLTLTKTTYFYMGNLAGTDIRIGVVGMRWKTNYLDELGSVFEFSHTDREDLMKDRLTEDYILRLFITYLQTMNDRQNPLPGVLFFIHWLLVCLESIFFSIFYGEDRDNDILCLDYYDRMQTHLDSLETVSHHELESRSQVLHQN